MKISFLLPTNRSWITYGRRVVNSIEHSIHRYDYEILVHSPKKINDDRIIWYEDTKEIGQIYCYNYLAEKATGDYLFCLIDDHITDDWIFWVVDYLNGETFKERRYKICSIKCGSPCPIPCHPPFPFTEKWLTLRFPVLDRETYEMLGKKIFREEFLKTHSDIWLGWFLGTKGEPPLECPHTSLYEFENITGSSNTGKIDEETLLRLVSTYKEGDLY